MWTLRKTCFVALAALAIPLLATLFLTHSNAQATAPGRYSPPPEMLPTLGKIADLIPKAKVIDKTQFGKHGATIIATLPGGELYFQVPTMDVDDDGDASGSPQGWEGHPVRSGKIDTARQPETSYGSQLPKRQGHTDAISPFEVPYVVLPGHEKPLWFAQHGIKIGDGVMVIRGDKCVEAVFADAGPDEKIGEMSIKAHQLFGEMVLEPGKKAVLGKDGKPLVDPKTQQIVTAPATVTRNSASKGPFVVIVFPGTSVKRDFVSVDASLKSTIDKRFQALAK